jgi:hypothetical protein
MKKLVLLASICACLSAQTATVTPTKVFVYYQLAGETTWVHSSVTIDPAAFAVTKSATGTFSLALKPAPAPGSFPGDVSLVQLQYWKVGVAPAWDATRSGWILPDNGVQNLVVYINKQRYSAADWTVTGTLLTLKNTAPPPAASLEVLLDYSVPALSLCQ